MATSIHPINVAAPAEVPSVGFARLSWQAVKKAWQWLAGWAWVIVLALRIHYAKIDPNMKCPSCGHRQGKIKWEPEIEWTDKSGQKRRGIVLHTCDIDGAVWGEPAIVKAEHWRLTLNDQQRGDTVPFLHRPMPDQTRSFQ